MKSVITFIFIMFNTYSFAQKAFEMEHYYGKTKNFEIKLSLANGYTLGSEVIKTDLASDKKIKYIPYNDTGGNSTSVVFLPDITDLSVNRGKRNKIILYHLKKDDEILPAKIMGVYGIDLKTYSFKLFRQKANH